MTGASSRDPWPPRWSNKEGLDTPLGNLVPWFDTIGALAIPYARLPPRLGVYAEVFPRWADVATQTPNSLLQRPKFGDAAVRALIEAAQEAVHARQEAAAGSVGAEVAVARLTERLNNLDRALLSGLVWVPDPPSWREVTQRLRVPLARVPRHLRRARARFDELLADPTHDEVHHHADRLRQRLGPYLPASVLEDELRRLGVQPATDTAALLLHLAGPYVENGGWVENTAIGGRAQAAAAVDKVFDRQPAPSPDVLRHALTGQGMSEAVAHSYLETHERLRAFGAVCVRWTGDTTGNMAEAALHVLGTPSTAKVILTTIGDETDKTVAKLSSTLTHDHRFLRASRTTWALHSWAGITEYHGIANAISYFIDARGGEADTEEVTDYLLDTYPDVARSSIRTYLSTLQFVITDGVVRRRTKDDEWPEIAPLVHTVRGAFPISDHEITLLIPVTADVLRGAGQAIPRALATVLGVDPGQQRTFTSPHGPVTVHWPLASTSGARISTLRSQASALAATTTDTLVLTFNTRDARVGLSRVGPEATAMQWAHTLFRRAVTDPVAALAPGLQCQPNEVTGVLRVRGDRKLADILEDI
ncbi:MAG: winged helix-turn-helix domain-containing protein [Actinomycetia bacterium]|nr:winged helix-turn-helix domain-containing protein [Actinomycetes bacterium]